MIAFFEKLTRRKTEAARQGQTAWQELVIAVADDKEQDADNTLAELDRLNKTPQDLEAAVELLGKRRELAKQVADGTKAENEFKKINAAIDAEVAKFTAASELHDATMRPLIQKKEAAVTSIKAADFGRRQLIDTASDPILLLAVRDADAAMVELRREKADHDSRLRLKSDALHKYQTWPDQFTDAADRITRLQAEVETMQAESAAFDAKGELLNTESEQARKRLQSPEAI